MHEILSELREGSLVLDLGCASGSFAAAATAARVVRLDRESAADGGDGAWSVNGDAARLPFADGSIAGVISNHSLEHFEDLEGALRELGRVIRPEGALYVAVPDASTLTDRLYRWLGRGGGHVNAFTSQADLADAIERATGLRYLAGKTLCSSLAFLNRRNSPRPAPLRLLLLGAGYEWTLFVYAWLSRRIDRLLNTRTSIYGWALYFGNIAGAIDTETWVNVCIRCGSGCPSRRLMAQVHSVFPGVRVYRCLQCGARNPFAEDRG